MSAYKVAIDHITGTIDRRAKYFRNLIIFVVLNGLVSFVWAVFAWEWSALVELALLLPVCGMYFFLDSNVLNEWRLKLFESWINGEIDFEVLRQTVAGLTMLPKDTLQSMLATLPSAGDILAEQGISSSTREAVASLLMSINTYRSDLIALKIAGYTVAAGALIAASVFWKWQPLLGLFVIALVPIARKLSCHLVMRRARKKTLTIKQQPDFNTEKYKELVAAMDWAPISVQQKNDFLMKMS